MCGHRTAMGPTALLLPTPMIPSKRDVHGHPILPARANAFEEPGPLLPSAAGASSGWGGTSTSALGAVGQDVLDALAAFLHPLDLARLSLCSRALLRDAEHSAALWLRRASTSNSGSSTTTKAAEAAEGASSQRYRYLCAFEVAAAGGEKLKAALRQIYEEDAVGSRDQIKYVRGPCASCDSWGFCGGWGLVWNATDCRPIMSMYTHTPPHRTAQPVGRADGGRGGGAPGPGAARLQGPPRAPPQPLPLRHQRQIGRAHV